MKSLPVLLAIFLIFSSPTALSQSTDVLSILSFEFQPDNIVEKSAGNITIEVEVKNVSTSIVSTDVEFSENSDTLPTITSLQGVQNIPAGETKTFTVQYDLTPTVEGNNYTVYARVNPAENETVLGNNSLFGVLSVINTKSVLPINETSLLIIPLMLLGILYFVWKDDKNEPQLEL